MKRVNCLLMIMLISYGWLQSYGWQLLLAGLLMKASEILLTPYLVWIQTVKRKKTGIKVISHGGCVSLADYLSSMQKHEQPEVTVLIPAYNEENRIRPMLTETITSLSKNRTSYELIVINDCSKDKTSQVVSEFFHKDIDIKIVEYCHNRGKGGAIRLGGLLAKGKNILMADADGATKFDDYYRLQKRLDEIRVDGHGMVIGSRHHLNAVQRTILRDVLAKGYNVLLTFVCGLTIKDTQCGFKLFTRETGKEVFSVQHLERWAFDVELIMIAQHNGVRVEEMGVDWQEIDGSHLNVVEASFTMLRDFLMLRLLYVTGLWKFSDKYVLIN